MKIPFVLTLIIGAALVGALIGLLVPSKAAATNACALTGPACWVCIPDSCENLPKTWLLNEPTKVCVEYDGQDPSHCAMVPTNHWRVDRIPPFDVCWTRNCANGRDFSDTCTSPWRPEPPL